jgi:hypothetical protein
VTPRTLAYACVQVSDHSITGIYFFLPKLQARIAISSQSLWEAADPHGFDNEIFYNDMVRLFEVDMENEWAVETLDWINELSCFYY